MSLAILRALSLHNQSAFACSNIHKKGGVEDGVSECLAGRQLGAHPLDAGPLVRLLLLPLIRVGRIPLGLVLSLP
jgi:hypothetical protein